MIEPRAQASCQLSTGSSLNGVQASRAIHGRLECLDGLRGWASLCVVMSHIVGAFGLGSLSILNSFPLRGAWDGAAAVAVFFVLSGFVLCLPFIDRARDVRGYARACAAYWVRRVFRIYPAHIFVIALCVALLGVVWEHGSAEWSPWLLALWNAEPSAVQVAKNAFLLAPGTDTHLINPVIWTLIVEMRISLVFPVVAIIGETAGIFGLLVLASVLGFALMSTPLPGTWSFLFQFVLGALLFHLYRSRTVWWPLLPPALAILAIWLYWLSLGSDAKDAASSQILLGLVCFCLIGASLIFSPLTRFLQMAFSRFLGRISFTLYLVHLPTLLLLSKYFHPRGAIEGSVFCLAYVSCSVSIALLLTQAIERPFMSIGRRVSKSILA